MITMGIVDMERHIGTLTNIPEKENTYPSFPPLSQTSSMKVKPKRQRLSAPHRDPTQCQALPK